jgi:phosphoribosylaminoimidazole (AIR) synthetase
VDEAEMDRVFNRGVGMALVVAAGRADEAAGVLEGAGHRASVIGAVEDGPGVRFG